MMKTPRYGRLASVLLLAALGAACADGGETAQNGAPAGLQADGQLPEGHPPIESSPYSHQDEGEAPAGPAAVVLEVHDVTDYTYALVRAEGEEIWVAGPRTGLAEGDTVSLGGAMGMTDFTSSELDRTFESILFLDAWRAPAALPEGNRGEVLEVVSASSYTYVRAATEDGEVWLAGPRVALESGQTIAWPEGMAMRDFTSNTLDRTFDVIWFVDAIRVVE